MLILDPESSQLGRSSVQEKLPPIRPLTHAESLCASTEGAEQMHGRWTEAVRNNRRRDRTPEYREDIRNLPGWAP